MFIKDKIVTTIMKPFLNSYLSDIGIIKQLSINSKEKKIYLEIELAGEDKSLEIDVQRYDIEKIEDQNFIHINEVTFSREWINLTLKKFMPDLKVPIPTIAKIAL